MRAGIVYWAPPAAALEAVAAAASDAELSQYGPDAGMPALREALVAKLAAENGIHQVRETLLADRLPLPSCVTLLTICWQPSPTWHAVGAADCTVCHASSVAHHLLRIS